MARTQSITVDTAGVTFGYVPVGLKSIDICFDEQRVWSVDVRSLKAGELLAWPEALTPYLRGSTTVHITDSSSDTELHVADLTFTDDDARVCIVNAEGVELSLNKWLRLAPSLSAIGGDIQERILDRAEEIIAQLRDFGLRPFVVGGTLLGGVRDGKLLPHDDDADIAYLSEYTSPAEVAVQGYRVGRYLQSLGHTLMRHSATHMQLHFTHEASATDYYIDVFGAFFTDDGNVNQPFHVRGPMREDQMLPFGEVTISGRVFPVPRDANAWLEINYDADWRTPIPGFEIVTPEATRRRFQNWFGSFNFGRHFWNDWYGSESSVTPWQTGADWIVSQGDALRAPQLLELGAGDGALSTRLATPKRQVIATDYAREPLQQLTRLSHTHHIQAEHLNLFRLTTLAAPFDFDLGGTFDAVANHVIEQVTPEARQGAYRLMRLALESGGAALATFHSVHADDLSDVNPTTWHLTRQQVADSAAEAGLHVTFVNLDQERTNPRQPVGAVFTLGAYTPPIVFEEQTMKQKIIRTLRAFDPRITRRKVRELDAEVEALKQELDEYRAYSAKLAELLDLAESRFSDPNAHPPATK